MAKRVDVRCVGKSTRYSRTTITRPLLFAAFCATHATSSKECSTESTRPSGATEASPAIMLGITVRYFDHFHGQCPLPEEDRDQVEFLRRAAKIVNAIHIDDSVIAQNPYSDGPK